MRAVIGKPACHELGTAFAKLAGSRKHPCIHAEPRQLLQILRILFLDPESILFGVQRIANTDRHKCSTLPGPTPATRTMARRVTIGCAPGGGGRPVPSTSSVRGLRRFFRSISRGLRGVSSG